MNYINERIIKENKFLNNLEYIIIFLMMFISSSFYMTTSPGVVIIGCHYVCIFILFIISLLSNRKIIINSNITLKLITLAAIIFMGSLSARGEEAKQTLINVMQLTIAYLYALNFNFDQFLKKYTNILYFLCWYSLILYALYMIVPSLVELLPDIRNLQGKLAQNGFFATVYGGKNGRNQGMFWEPGAFQTYINLAFIFELFYFKNITKTRIIIYVLTIFTTFSTAGYITTLFIVYTYLTELLFSEGEKEKKSARNIFFILTVVIVIVMIFLSMDTDVSRHVFNKFNDYKESGYGANRRTTASVRFDAFLKPITLFWKYPMFGAGTRGMENFADYQRYSMNTCTFVNWFAYFGILYGALMMQMYYKFAKRISKNKLIVFMIFFAVFLATATENYYRNPSMLIFAFFPSPKESEVLKHEKDFTEYKSS